MSSRNDQQPPRPPTRLKYSTALTKAGEATRLVNNSQQTQARPSTKSFQIPHHHKRLKHDGQLQDIGYFPVSTVSQSDFDQMKQAQRSGSPGPIHQRLSAISKDSNRNSQISTVSTNASDGQRIKARIGPWKLGKTLGKGATARVRLARHAFTGQQAAIKIVQKKNAQMSQAGSLPDLDSADAGLRDKDDGVKRMPIGIEREVAIMKLIQHPNIMKLYDIWENRTEIYLVLEYVDNGELFEHITKKGRLHEEEAIRYFRQMLSAVGYCHSFNICHRDLKPENILLTNDLTIKIADFGMAALHQGPEYKLKTSCGSPHYAAPELIKGALYRGDKVDIWSMGVILYATLAGRLPFDVDGNDRDFLSLLLGKIKLGNFEMQPEFSPEAQNLIWRILQVDPRNRINMKQIWMHPLIRKYDYLDDYGAGSFPLSPSIKSCGRPVVRKSDVNKDLLRQLRSMWHRLSENDLMEALLSEKPNEQKLFYSLLSKYRDAQLEDYVPDVVYSTSDYHHVRPVAMTKTYSTYNFTQPKITGHGLQISRFTVISNVAETEQSYDPFKALRSQHLNHTRTGERPKATIHRARPNEERRRAMITTTQHQERNSELSIRLTGNSVGGIQRQLASHRSYASRSSLASSIRSGGSGSYHRVNSGYKRGISFTRLRRPASSHPGLRRGYYSNFTEVIDNDGDTLRPVGKTSTKYIRSRKSHLSSGPLSSVAETKQGRTSLICSDDVSQLSSSLAKDCDEAFNRLGTVEENPRRHSVPMTPSRKMPQSSLEVPSKKLKRASLDDRPLPRPPAQSDDLKHELLEARKQAELRRASGGSDSPTYLNRMVSHINCLIQPASTPSSEHRSFSAPVDPQAVRPNKPLPSIFEARKEEKLPPPCTAPSSGVGHRSTRPTTQNTRIASAPEPRDTRATIRVVQADSPAKVPAPLTIRKKSSPRSAMPVTRHNDPDKSTYGSRKAHAGCDARQQYQFDTKSDTSQTNAGYSHSYDDSVNDSNVGTVIKKKSTWFKRNSKSGNEHDWKMSGGASQPLHSQNSSTDTTNRTPSIPPASVPQKKKFSFVRLFKKRSSHSDMMHLGNESFDVRPESDSDAELFDDDRCLTNSRRVSSNEDTKTRQIAPQRNWIAKLFNVKPVSKMMCLTVPKSRARGEVVRILREWKRYGIREVQLDKARSLVFARVASNNFLNMKEVSFAAEFMAVIHHGNKGHLCIARLTQERGAASSFDKVYATLDKFLRARGMLVSDERKVRMMIKTLQLAEKDGRMPSAQPERY
ncbi:hypothetical protein BJ878DRAFT_476836 [Calycina marina]|uniref:non-specific serine/threonine protein kinase n=1 Tax=Calycina marina TaxID=1763456 RepID=A0A9P7Z9Y0_9HELO|nr:hypothetical protein BJ878DRAFT_476836 [Calycina marina]